VENLTDNDISLRFMVYNKHPPRAECLM